jgi:hypothetical protein
LIHRGQRELDFVFEWKRGANLYQFFPRGKAGPFNFKLVNAVGQAFDVQVSLIAGNKCTAILIGPADDLDGGL